MKLDTEIEAILYYKNEPLSIKKLAKILSKDEGEILLALDKLRERLQTGGLCLISKDDEVSLGTAKGMAPLIEKMIKDELTKDLGRAALDTLTIILYYGPISKTLIDNIRGVSSSFIIRNLLIRGLIERTLDENDQRSFIYKPTFKLLSYLGIVNINELPEYEELKQSLEKNLTEIKENETTPSET